MENIDHLFIEQAEYLEDQDFNLWTLDHPSFSSYLTKLSGPGAKLIVGPRGSGKTTILLSALSKINQLKNKHAVYINFKKSLSLEPFYRGNLNPSFFFNQWLLAKTLIAILESTDNKINDSKLKISRDLVNKLENGTSSIEPSEVLSYEDIFLACDNLLNAKDAERLIVLMDDAAHAFSSEQQRDFFDFFRSIKSKRLSPKAAIYPGVTVFSPAFQVGHDAENIDIWIDPVSPEYISFLRNVLKKRLPDEIFKKFNENAGLIELIAYSSFGIPRNFLNLIRDICDNTSNKNITSKNALDAITKSCKRSDELFISLKFKLSRYSNYVQTGRKFFENVIKEIKQYNKEKDLLKQSITLAIKIPIDDNLLRVIGFLEYSGLIFPFQSDVSRGEKGTFARFYISISHLVESNAIVVSKGKKIDSFVQALKSRNAHEFTRVSHDTLLKGVDTSNGFQLALSPCAKCNTPRLNESSKFCHSCGAPLTEASMFYELIDKDISNLPLTAHRVRKIKENSQLKTIKDILNDLDYQQLRSVPQIGDFWAKRIYGYAEEYIS